MTTSIVEQTRAKQEAVEVMEKTISKLLMEKSKNQYN